MQARKQKQKGAVQKSKQERGEKRKWENKIKQESGSFGKQEISQEGEFKRESE